ncbi:MAG: magnesium transporter CorA family protein [Desulfitobacteriaceae bacterium]|nr:magnesium transporter CorA family protein [Desulfitobacteriaceae bacterium]MDD4752285.1 magnesium transporter CorA family protein [Desulfitobacteriaceae bacterium]
MINIYRTVNDELVQLQSPEKGAWINITNPSEEELQHAAAMTGIFYDFLKYPLDDEERPRVEIEDNQLLIIISVPIIYQASVMYDTIPLGIIITNDYITTVSLQNIDIITAFSQGKVKGMATYKKTRFVFQLMQKASILFLNYLREINKKTDEIELELHKSMRNQELIRLLDLEKSLVYFSTSLRSNEKVMEKLLRTLKMYEEDHDLLEDVIIENKQAIEMADIYSNILSSTMASFASIISNNLNIVLKFLAAITIVVSLPTMVASFFGMNVALPFESSPHGFLIVLGMSLALSGLSIWYLIKRNMF